MYGGRGGLGVGGVSTTFGGGLAVTGVPIAIVLGLSLAVVAAGLLLLRWGRVRRNG
jgi:hypothetical protein